MAKGKNGKATLQSQKFVHMPLLFGRHAAEVFAGFRSGGKGITKEDPSKFFWPMYKG